MRKRPNLGFDTALDDLSDLQATGKPRQLDAGSKDELVGVATASGFGSREGLNASERHAERPRRRRTGRNAQLNIKARPETIAEFCSIADENGWGLGETLEHAVELLRRRKWDLQEQPSAENAILANFQYDGSAR